MEYEKCECNWYMGGLVKDHHYGLPITMVDFHTQQGLVVSSDAKAVKLWNMRNVSVIVHGWVSHHYGLPITMVDFHTQQGLVVSSDAKAVKLWNMRNVSVMSTWVG